MLLIYIDLQLKEKYLHIYRSPIERKISAYFEKLGPYHFNNTDENINNYSFSKICKRFNKIFPYIAVGDHFMDCYEIKSFPESFDFQKKYLLVEQDNIIFIKLRLKDSFEWSKILTDIFKTEIKIVKDYETTNKVINPMFQKFKQEYKIPSNFLDEIKGCKYLNYYYSSNEVNEYISLWSKKLGENIIPFSESEFKLYEEISLENNHIDQIQVEHYLDQGCTCKGCNSKRQDIIRKIRNGTYQNERIIHEEVKHAIIRAKVSIITAKLRNITGPKRSKHDFNADMKNVVSSKR